MAQETERKFIVAGDFRPFVCRTARIVQGYLSSVPERTVRVRIRDDKGYLTVKGLSDSKGISRFEWEKEIDLREAEELMRLCEPGIIGKNRHIIEYEGHIFEVDEFFGENAGLVIAEIELSSEDEEFGKPQWLGREVTGDPRYYNSALMKCPYSSWGRRQAAPEK